MDNNFFEALADLGTENSVDTEIIIEKVKSAMQKAAARMYPECKECIRVDIDPENQIFEVYILQEVVDEEPINHTQIHIDEARAASRHSDVPLHSLPSSPSRVACVTSTVTASLKSLRRRWTTSSRRPSHRSSRAEELPR